MSFWYIRGTQYNLLNALAEKLELHTGETVLWSGIVSGMSGVSGKHSKN